MCVCVCAQLTPDSAFVYQQQHVKVKSQHWKYTLITYRPEYIEEKKTERKRFVYKLYCIVIPYRLYLQNSGVEKAFLFDVVSKIYLATDSSPVDMQSFELCCDMIDVVIDLSSIYR